ncbi:hypothetical protein CSB20_06365 [bacterium DOLZORAL124_64_63]|nr:MAG: hypothetical protein CSB20_06365 [bacterium DOLZORAL124_64_63]
MRKYALLILPLCLLLCGGQALGIEAQLTPVEHADTHEIGKEIVLRFDIRWDSDAALNPESLQISPQSEGGDFFSTPYPPKVTANQAGSARIEWAAPLPEDIEPGDRSLALSILARDKAGAEVTGAWTGSLHVDFGEKWSANRIQNFIETRGRFVFLLLIFGFGLLMSLSPCIYPMIPITLAVIGAQNKDKGVLNGLVTSLTYAVGMALVYAIIGFLIASGTSGLTATMQSPIVLVPISLLLMVLSLSMFGAYELQAPQFLRDKLGGPGGSEKAGLLGAFAMGMVAGLIASPCVGPFLSGLLIFFATTGDGVLAFISLFIFGMGMSMLLIAVGTFPALLGNLPQAGGWMETLNRGMGLLLVGMAFYFLRPGSVIPAKFFYPLVGGLMVVVSCFMGAFDSQAPGTGWWDRTRKGLGILVFVFGLMFVIGSNLQNGFVGKAWRSLLADSMPQTVAVTGHAGAGATAQTTTSQTTTAQTTTAPAPLPKKVPWEKIHTGEGVKAFIDAKRAEAKAAGKPVMIDFWANWCVYCKKLDKLVWNQPPVVEESLRFVTLKVDATKADDADMSAVKEEFRVPGLPQVIFIDSRGEILHGRTSGFKSAEEMLEVMKSIR